MRHILAFVFLASPLLAQSVTSPLAAPSAPPIIRFTVPSDSPSGVPVRPAAHRTTVTISAADGSDTVYVGLSGFAPITLKVTNSGAQTLKVSGISFNFPLVFAPIEPLSVGPGETMDLQCTVYCAALNPPQMSSVYLQVNDGTNDGIVASKIMISSKDMVVLGSHTAMWVVGSPTAARDIPIVNVPAGITVTGAKVSSAAFTATVVGSTLRVTPSSTAQPANAVITLTTTADTLLVAGRPVRLMAFVMPAPIRVPASPGGPPRSN